MTNIRNSQEYIKKPAFATNEGLANLKTTFRMPSLSHVRRKTILASICVLTLICLAIVIEDFGSLRGFVKADSVIGIGVGIYWDRDCTNSTRSLDWGFINPNSNNSLTIFIRNELSSPLSLWLRTSSWTPSNASSYMTLSWNCSGQILKTNEAIPIQLTLTVSPSVIGISDFNFETTITSVLEH
jgi:hypothetical protein